MTRRLNRNEIAAIVGNDPRAIRAFERLLGDVQANISGPATIVLNYNNDGSVATALPLATSYQLTPEDGGAYTSGVSWGVTVLSGTFDSTAPTIGGTGTGVLLINSGLVSSTATLGVTARIDGRGYPPFTVTVSKSVAPAEGGSGGGTASDSTTTLTSITTGSFTTVTRELAVTLPTGITVATLTAAAIELQVASEAPVGQSQIELKWQNETAPAVWSDVGAVATSSPSPTVTSEGDFLVGESGAVTCNRTATGLAAGSAQKFRLVGRISSGNVRTIFPVGSASVSA